MKTKNNERLESLFSGKSQIKCRIIETLLNGSFSISMLARLIGTSRSLVSKDVNELAGEGLISLEKNSDNKREKIVKLAFRPQDLQSIDSFIKWQQGYNTQLNTDRPLIIKTSEELILVYNEILKNSQPENPVIFLAHNDIEAYRTIIPKIAESIDNATKNTVVYWIAPTKTENFFNSFRKDGKLKNLLLFYVDDTSMIEFKSAAMVVHKSNRVVFSNLVAGKKYAISYCNKQFADNFYYFLKNFLSFGLACGMVMPANEKMLPEKYRQLINYTKKNPKLEQQKGLMRPMIIEDLSPLQVGVFKN